MCVGGLKRNPAEHQNIVKEEKVVLAQRVVALRRQGKTYDQIGAELDMSPRQVAYLFKKTMDKYVSPEVAELRVTEGDRLDMLQSAVWPNAMMGDPHSVAAVLKIMDRRAKLFGLDMPAKIQQEITVWNGDLNVEREIQHLIARISSSGGGSGDVADSAGTPRAIGTGR